MGCICDHTAERHVQTRRDWPNHMRLGRLDNRQECTVHGCTCTSFESELWQARMLK